MASNPYVNKVELADGTTLIDLTGDTVAANKMLYGYTAHDASGAEVTGSIENGTITNNLVVTVPTEGTLSFGKKIKIGAGYYPGDVYYVASTPIGTRTVSTPGQTIVSGYAYAKCEYMDVGSGESFVTRNNGSTDCEMKCNGGTTEVVVLGLNNPSTVYVTAYESSLSYPRKCIVENGAWVTTTPTTNGTYYGKVVVNKDNFLQQIYPVGSLWATKDSTKDPATELGFGTWTKISPVQPTWGRLEETSTWASVQIDEPTVYVWERTA